MSTIAPAHLLGLIDVMRTRHPDIALQIADARAETLEQRLLAGELDAGMYALPSLSYQERLNRLPLYSEPFVVAMRPEHPLAWQNAISFRDLAGETRVGWSACEHEVALRDAFAQHGIDARAAYQHDRIEWLLAMVAAGLGYAVMPEMSVNASGIVARPLINPEISREIALVSLRERAGTPGMAALMREAIRWSAVRQLGFAEDRMAVTR
jgi:DNA-binding transcriptional LysR family regulator